MINSTLSENRFCPCGTGKTYMDCCGLFISHQKIPSTPEELMRSRYTAYSLANIDYIIHTMKSPAADHFDAEEACEWAKKASWAGLDVIKTQYDDNKGLVEFRARYSLNGNENILHELSEFICENGKWYYVNGIQPTKKYIARAAEKIGRNDSCPCGSHKKYKKCCGKTHH